MNSDVVRDNASLGSHPRVLARCARSARQPARRPSRHSIPHSSFRSLVWEFWRKGGRHKLPWRQTNDPYRILVSEVMLQQTQVDRVVPHYKKFLKAFPSLQILAKAPLSDVLKVWSGLGYNRRGKYLHDTARIIVEKYGGKIPDIYSDLVEQPGVGDYTARAIRVFAFNEPEALIETNIRTALIHHLFPIVPIVSDRTLLVSAHTLAKGQNPREWHWALMDYGAHLKRSGIRNNHQSAHYMRQSKFEGSLRQVRGEILRKLGSGEFVRSREYAEALAGLAKDGLVTKQKGKWRIA